MIEKKRVAILISGRGSNMEALIQSTRAINCSTHVVCIIADNEKAKGVEIAQQYDIPTYIIPRAHFTSKKDHEKAIEDCLDTHQIDCIALAGYMRLLSNDFVGKREGKIINIHPSLLPSFKGLNTHARALEEGVRIHGCTVHFVTTEMDEGPIIAQAAAPVFLFDSIETLSARILKLEHKLYPLCLNWLTEGKVSMQNKKVFFHHFNPQEAIETSIVYPNADKASLHSSNK